MHAPLASLHSAPPARPPESDELAAHGLHYVTDQAPGFTRRRSGTGFSYRDVDGRPIRSSDTLKRIKALAIPPAYSDVWICPDPLGHIQATGRDAKGRKQYRYHARWRMVRDATKYDHVIAFATALPALRTRIAADMGTRGLSRDRVLATIVNLLETTLIRVGNEDYAKANRSYGLTTLRNRHVAVDGSALRFHFKGKSGKVWKLHVSDRRVARVVKACQDLPGQHLFQYVDAEGARVPVTSADVNAYLREASGRDVTAKDFRTWAGTVLAARAVRDLLAEHGAVTKKALRGAIVAVANRLGNTPTICRACYIHPDILAAAIEGSGALVQAFDGSPAPEATTGLKADEVAVLSFLRARQGRDLTSAFAESLAQAG